MVGHQEHFLGVINTITKRDALEELGKSRLKSGWDKNNSLLGNLDSLPNISPKIA